jgi:phosphoribosylanthranilate isomerase
VDHIGSVLVSAEVWRQPRVREAAAAARDGGAKNSLIPLFPDEGLLARAVEYYRPHLIHYCESLTDEQGRVRNLQPVIEAQVRFKERFPEVGIIRTLPIPGPGRANDFPALEIAAALEGTSDFFLTDTWLGREPVEGYLGITGKPGDWEMTERVVRNSRIPVILAGGLSPENVYEAALKIRPAGVDSCTLTNAVDGEGKPIRFQKDFAKVAAFVAEARRARESIGLEKRKRCQVNNNK